MSKLKRGQLDVDFSAQILQGVDALELLDDAEFKLLWLELLNECQFGSVFQHPSFVLPWYRQNLEEFTPVVLLTYAEKKLVGLLTLARKIEAKKGKYCKKLIGAGSFFALYQTWLVLPGYEIFFWEKGLKFLFEEIPGSSINLKSLPSKGVFKEISHLGGFKKMSVLEKHLNPVLDFQREEYLKIIGKRHFRSKFNRLNRAGEAVFEKIATVDDFISSMKTIEVFHNLRQGAAFNKTPFIQRDNQKELFWEWFEKGLLHVTVLRLNQELIAAVLIVNDFGITAHLAGLITYSPIHAKLSPGLVHLYLLGQMLRNESFKDLKLSPGNDAYKERFSNSYENLYEILISHNFIDRIIRKSRVNVRSIFLNFGFRPMEVQVWVSKKIAILKNKFFNWKNQLFTRKLSQTQILEKLNQFEEKDFFESKIQYHFNELWTLLLADDFTFELSRWEFLEDSLKRLEAGFHFVTLVKGNNLLACLWTEENFDNSSVLKEILNGKGAQMVFFSKNILSAFKK